MAFMDWEPARIKNISHAHSEIPPAAISFAGHLWVFFVGKQNLTTKALLLYTRLDYGAWSEPSPVTYGPRNKCVFTEKTPVVTSRGKNMHMIVTEAVDYQGTMIETQNHYVYGSMGSDDCNSPGTWSRLGCCLIGAVLDATLLPMNDSLFYFYRTRLPTEAEPKFRFIRWRPREWWDSSTEVILNEGPAKATAFVWLEHGVPQICLFKPSAAEAQKVIVWQMTSEEGQFKREEKAHPGFVFEDGAAPDAFSVATDMGCIFIAYKISEGPENIRTVLYRDMNRIPPHDRIYNEQALHTPIMVTHLGDIYCIWNSPNRYGSPQLRYAYQSISWPLCTWMRWVDNTTPVSQITLPGTHDSGAVDGVAVDGMINMMATCQLLSIPHQLRAGIRFLDLRGGYGWYDLIGWRQSEEAVLHHNMIPITPFKTIRETFEECYRFLEENPSEFLVISLKYDPKSPVARRRIFAQEMERLITGKDHQYWHIGSDIPKIKDVRGKVILFRRFEREGQGEFGVNCIDGWEDQMEECILQRSGFRLLVQDAWNLSWPMFDQERWPTFGQEHSEPHERKWAVIKKGFDKSSLDANPSHWYVNFTSATWVTWPMGPQDIAQGWTHLSGEYFVPGINDRLKKFFMVNSRGHFGLVIMDFADRMEELVRLVISTNVAHFTQPI